MLPTVVLPQIKTAQYLQSSRPTTPLLFLTWKLTPQSTTLLTYREDLTSKHFWKGSRTSSNDLKPPWCLERARYQKEQTRTWHLAAILSVAPSLGAAIVDGTNSHSDNSHNANDDIEGNAGGTALILPQEVMLII